MNVGLGIGPGVLGHSVRFILGQTVQLLLTIPDDGAVLTGNVDQLGIVNGWKKEKNRLEIAPSHSYKLEWRDTFCINSHFYIHNLDGFF